MTESKHTPWRAHRINGGITINHKGERIAWIADIHGDHRTQDEHAALIAAAPETAAERDRLKSVNAELLKRLNELVDAIDGAVLELNSLEIGGHDDIPLHPWHEEWLHHTRAAIAKAKTP